MAGFDNAREDGWGRNIIYQLNSDQSITLKSFGKDGIEGGESENQDIIRTIYFKDKDGNWFNDVDTYDQIANVSNN